MWCVCVCVRAASICPSKQSWQTNLMWPRKGQPHSDCLPLTLCTASPSLLPSFFLQASFLLHPRILSVFLSFNSAFSFSLATSVYFSHLPRQQSAERWRLIIVTVSLRPPPAVRSSPVSGAPTPSACVSPRRRLRSEEAGGIKGLIGSSGGPHRPNERPPVTYSCHSNYRGPLRQEGGVYGAVSKVI